MSGGLGASALVVGCGGPHGQWVASALLALSYDCELVADADAAVTRLERLAATDKPPPDVVLVDCDGEPTLVLQVGQRLVPRLAAFSLPTVWIGGDSRPTAKPKFPGATVALNTPCSVADLAEALTTVQWAADQLPPPPRRREPSDQTPIVPSRRPTLPMQRLDAEQQVVTQPVVPEASFPPAPTPATRRPRRQRSGLVRGQLIDGRFEVRRRLGRGGMGDVYEVMDRELRDIVALKMLRRGADDELAERRFLREMKICRRLHHPNIVVTYEFGFHIDLPFFTMELLQGRDLGAICKLKRRPPLRRCLRWLTQVAAGLQHAHEAGVLHRDIKPQNMFVLDGGEQAKVMDFGVAKGLSAEDTDITHAETMVGTPAYFSPERLADQAEGPHIDIYALGAVLYHVLTGQPPYPHQDLPQLLTAIVTRDPVPVQEVNPRVPARLARLVERAMAREVADRIDSCEQIRRELIAIMTTLPR